MNLGKDELDPSGEVSELPLLCLVLHGAATLQAITTMI